MLTSDICPLHIFVHFGHLAPSDFPHFGHMPTSYSCPFRKFSHFGHLSFYNIFPLHKFTHFEHLPTSDIWTLRTFSPLFWTYATFRHDSKTDMCTHPLFWSARHVFADKTMSYLFNIIKIIMEVEKTNIILLKRNREANVRPKYMYQNRRRVKYLHYTTKDD